MHTEIEKFLEEIGLTETESLLYVTGLAHGPLSASELAKRTGIRRTTVYSALAALEQKGIAGVSKNAQVLHYQMQSPELIEHHLKEQIHTLQERKKDFADVLPLFEALLGKDPLGTSVSSFEGEKAVRSVIDMALFCVSRKWKIIAPTRNYFSDGDKKYSDYFIKIRIQRGIKARSLWEPSFLKKRKFDQTAFDMRDPKVLPKALEGKFKSTLILFDNKVVFISSAAERTAVLIESKEIYETIEIFFDGLWFASKPLSKRYRVPC